MKGGALLASVDPRTVNNSMNTGLHTEAVYALYTHSTISAGGIRRAMSYVYVPLDFQPLSILQHQYCQTLVDKAEKTKHMHSHELHLSSYTGSQ